MGTGENKRGRPKGTTPEQMTSLAEMDGRSVPGLREVLSYLPQKLRDTICGMSMTRGEIQRVNNTIAHISSGIYTSSPLVCCGDACPYTKAGRCPLEGMAPVGQDCPVELYHIAKWAGAYAEALAVDPGNFIEMDMIGTIVNCDIMIYRIRNYMSRSPDGHIDMNAVGIDRGGNVLLSRDISKEIMIEEKYQRIKDRKLEQLLATRESKAKYDVVDIDNPATRGSQLKAIADGIRRKNEAKAEFMEGHETK